jgi:hypothetical protein
MFQFLTEYLFQHGKLFVPFIGNFTLSPRSAVNDFVEQTIYAPGWDIVFTHLSEDDATLINANNETLFRWLSERLHISKAEAMIKYDAFSDELKSKFNNGEIVDWSGMGQFEKVDGKIIFTPISTAGIPFTGVTAKKMIRENVIPNVLVSENEVFNEDMITILEGERSRGAWGKFFLWTILFLLLGAIVWYLFFKA